MTQKEANEPRTLETAETQEVYRMRLGAVSAAVLARDPDLYAVSLEYAGRPLCVLESEDAARMLEALDGCLNLVQALQAGDTVHAWKARSGQEEELFAPGLVVLTPGAAAALTRAGISPTTLLRRHLCGDWGQVCVEDAEENVRSLREGLRLLSVYPLSSHSECSGVEEVVWIITEADRSATTLLLPCEY